MKSAFWALTLVATVLATSTQAGTEVGDYSGLPKDLARAATDYDLAQFKSSRAELERPLGDVTLEEIRIECSFPADDWTAEFCTKLARGEAAPTG